MYSLGEAGLFWGIFLSFFVVNIVMAATTQAVSERYLGQEATILGSYRAVTRRLFSFLITMFVANLMVGIGLALLIIPGVIIYCWYAFIPIVFMLEGKSWTAARNRSKILSVNEYWRIILLWFVGFAITRIVAFGFEGLWVMIFKEANGPLIGITLGIVAALTTPIQVILLVLLYYDIRIKKEGFDIEILTAELELSSASKNLKQLGSEENPS